MFGEAWSPMSVPDLAPDDDDDYNMQRIFASCMVWDLKSVTAIEL